MKYLIPIVLIFINQFVYAQNNTNRKPVTIDGSEFESIEVSKIKAEREKFVYDSIAKSEYELMEIEVSKALSIEDSIVGGNKTGGSEETQIEDESQFTPDDWNYIITFIDNGQNLKIIHDAKAIMGWEANEVTKDKCIAALPIFKKANISSGINFFQLAFCEFVLGLYEDAIFDFTKAINNTPNKLFEETSFIKNNGKIEEMTYFPINLNRDDAFYYRAICKKELKDYRGAISDFDKIELKFNKSAEFYLKRGGAKYYLEKYADAKLDFTKSLSIEKSSYAYFGRGICNIFLGLKESGCIDLSKAGELGHEEAYEAIKEYCNK
jgi:tetratricopeptide (TPR) repeat protein